MKAAFEIFEKNIPKTFYRQYIPISKYVELVIQKSLLKEYKIYLYFEYMQYYSTDSSSHIQISDNEYKNIDKQLQFIYDTNSITIDDVNDKLEQYLLELV